MLVEFSLKVLYSTMCGKTFQICRVHAPRKSVDFTHAHLPQNSPPSFCHHVLDRRKLLIPPFSILLKIYFPQQQKGAQETMIYFIKIQSGNTNIKLDLEY